MATTGSYEDICVVLQFDFVETSLLRRNIVTSSPFFSFSSCAIRLLVRIMGEKTTHDEFYDRNNGSLCPNTGYQLKSWKIAKRFFKKITYFAVVLLYKLNSA
ncbi:hypothetical protein OUZ56_008240 [Daphnia magna]|uniref:Uncharacterized protein n=1 Tax=Daphnia magna TaxID=35525 RepID=A0ABR0ACI7_9CRUS|nr:hypothetical protein OUZ56_008240 [Daphnia magna]